MNAACPTMKREAEKDGGAYAPRALPDALGITYQQVQKKRERPIASGAGRPVLASIVPLSLSATVIHGYRQCLSYN
jgi:hypothetical protein